MGDTGTWEHPLPKNMVGKPPTTDPYEYHMSQEYFQREYLVAVAEIKIMQDEMAHCFYKNGINQFELCKDIRDKLWKKIKTPNYGAPGPPRSSAKYM